LNTFTIQLLNNIGDTLAFIAFSFGAVLLILFIVKITKAEVYLSAKRFLQFVGSCFSLLFVACILRLMVAFGESNSLSTAVFTLSTAGFAIVAITTFRIAHRR